MAKREIDDSYSSSQIQLMPPETEKLQCIHCGTQFPLYPLLSICQKCGGILEYRTILPEKQALELSGALTFWRYKQLLPLVHKMVSLGEGGTPLHKADRLAKTIGLSNLYLKDETRNPTNSYRDRAAALLTSNAVDQQVKTLVCATNGNMGASLAAYAAKAELICHVLAPTGPAWAANGDLPGIGERGELRISDPVYTGSAESAEQYLIESIVQPGAFLVPEFQDLMPHTYGTSLGKQDVADLIAYMLTIK